MLFVRGFLYSEKPLELTIKRLIKKYIKDHIGLENSPPLVFKVIANRKSPYYKVYIRLDTNSRFYMYSH
jgi:hypothetical protein